MDGILAKTESSPHFIALSLLLLAAATIVTVVSWMLKKFHPGRAPDASYVGAIGSLVPQEPGFEAGWERRCLTAAMVASAAYTSPDFVAWIEGTVLMPRVRASSWSDFLSELCDSEKVRRRARNMFGIFSRHDSKKNLTVTCVE